MIFLNFFKFLVKCLLGVVKISLAVLWVVGRLSFPPRFRCNFHYKWSFFIIQYIYFWVVFFPIKWWCSTMKSMNRHHSRIIMSKKAKCLKRCLKKDSFLRHSVLHAISISIYDDTMERVWKMQAVSRRQCAYYAHRKRDDKKDDDLTLLVYFLWYFIIPCRALCSFMQGARCGKWSA